MTGIRGHRAVRGSRGWHCTCGVSLTGGVGYWELTGIPPAGRRAARDIMRFHRADLRLNECHQLDMA